MDGPSSFTSLVTSQCCHTPPSTCKRKGAARGWRGEAHRDRRAEKNPKNTIATGSSEDGNKKMNGGKWQNDAKGGLERITEEGRERRRRRERHRRIFWCLPELTRARSLMQTVANALCYKNPSLLWWHPCARTHALTQGLYLERVKSPISSSLSLLFSLSLPQRVEEGRWGRVRQRRGFWGGGARCNEMTQWWFEVSEPMWDSKWERAEGQTKGMRNFVFVRVCSGNSK